MVSWYVACVFLNDFEMVPVAHIITGITLVFTFHVRCISIVRFLCFKIFSASFLITFLSPDYYYYYYYYYYCYCYYYYAQFIVIITVHHVEELKQSFRKT